jgi:hypothetical protein
MDHVAFVDNSMFTEDELAAKAEMDIPAIMESTEANRFNIQTPLFGNGGSSDFRGAFAGQARNTHSPRQSDELVYTS